jgi:hypothetical protein
VSSKQEEVSGNVGCALRTNQLDFAPKFYRGTPLAAKLGLAKREAKLRLPGVPKGSLRTRKKKYI